MNSAFSTQKYDFAIDLYPLKLNVVDFFSEYTVIYMHGRNMLENINMINIFSFYYDTCSLFQFQVNTYMNSNIHLFDC